MDELNNEEIRKIYGNDPRSTKMKFPKCVTKRLGWVREYMDDGLTLYDVFMAVLAYDEKSSKKDFELSGTWLPVSDEFKAWRDDGSLGALKKCR